MNVSLVARVQGYVAGIATAGAATKEFSGKVTDLAATSESKFSKLSKGAVVAGGLLVGAFALAEKELLSFDKQMSAVDSVLDKTGKTAAESAAQLAALRGAAIKAGQNTAFTATEAAQAEEELAKAGISAADILGGALTGTLNLASAGTLELAQAATIAAQAMIEFNLKGKDVGHIADVLTAGANKSATDVAALGESLGQVGSVAHQAGIGLTETVGVLALFAQHGLVGEEAGTTFKTMLLKLEGPSAKAAALMKSLGLSVYDQQGHFLTAAGLADALQTSLGGLSEADRNAALATLFGTRAVRGAIDLYNAGAKGVDQWSASVNDTGIAARTAQTKLDNLSGDLKKLGGSLQAAAITATEHATPALRFLAQGAEAVTNDFSKMPGPIQGTIAVLGGVTGASLLGVVGFVKLKASTDVFMKTLIGLGPAGEKAASAIGGLTSAGGAFALFAIGTFAAGRGLGYLLEKLIPTPKPIAIVKHSVDELTASLTALANTGKVTGALAAAYGTNLSKLAGDINVLNFAPTFDPAKTNSFLAASISEKLQQAGYSVKQARQDVSDLNNTLIQMVQNGGLPQADLAFDDIKKKLLALGVPLNDVNTYFAKYYKATNDAALGGSTAANGFASVAQQTDLMNRSLGDTVAKLGSIDAAFKELNGGAIGAEQANITFRASLADLTQTLDKSSKASIRNGTALDITSKKRGDQARAIQSGILQAIQNAEAVSQATFVQTNSVDKASAAWDKQIAALKAVLKAAGFTDAQVKILLATYAKMPPLVSAPVKTPGLSEAVKQAQALAKALFGLPPSKTIQLKLQARESKVANEFMRLGIPNRDGGIYTHAATGALRDAGIYSAVSSGARYAFAEPGTGGEGFVPKNGDYGRSMGIIAHEAAWYGATLVPGNRGGYGSGGATAASYSHTTNVYPQFANLNPQDLDQLDRVREIRQRIGMPG